MKFTQELKDKWLAALRSGAYEQGRGQLQSDGRYCCLGVLEHVSGFNSAGTAALITSDSDYVFLDSYEQALLASMNDAGDTFHEIADHIQTSIPAV